MRTTLIAGVVFVAALVVWLALRDRATDLAPQPAAPAERAEGAAASARLEGATEPAKPAAAADTAERAAAPVPVAAATGATATATVKARCVDAAGRPLARVRARLNGWQANRERYAEYVREHGDVQWQELPEQVTDASGAFAFTFAPPPPYQFVLTLSRDDLVRTGSRWTEIGPGRVVDLGDVVMSSGCRVHGLVVDTTGGAQGDVEVRLDRETHGRRSGSRLDVPDQYQAKVQADGRFAFSEVVPAAAWELTVRGRQRVSPDRITVREEQLDAFVEIVVMRPEDVDAITGVIVDEQGNGVARVSVDHYPSAGGQRPMNSSRRDGAFRVERARHDPREPVRLSVYEEGFEPFQSEQQYPWGTRDVRIVLRRGVGVEVRVTDASSGEPVEGYGVRLWPTDMRVISSLDFELREQGQHPQGVCRLERVKRGRYWLFVEPGSTHAASEPVAVEVGDRGLRHEVQLGRVTPRTVRVERGGEPVAGSRVELMVTFGLPADEETVAMTRQLTLLTTLPNRAMVQDAGTTDAGGEARIAGSGTTRYALRISGQHRTVVSNGVVLGDGPDPLVIVVPAGATVRGRIVPATLVAQLRREAGLPDSGVAAEDDRWLLPGVRVSRREGDRTVHHPAGRHDARTPLTDDGTFSLAGIPAGNWSLDLVSSRRQGGVAYLCETVADLGALQEGEIRELELRLEHIVHATLRGRVLLDGEPPTGSAYVRIDRGSGPDGRARHDGMQLDLGADGAFSMTTPPGRARVEIAVQHANGSHWSRLRSDEEVALAPGQEVDAEFHVRSSRVRLRVRSTTGRAVVGVALTLKADPNLAVELPPTDSQGETSLLLEPNTWRARVVRKSLTDGAGSRKFWEQHQGDPNAWERLALVDAGTFVAAAGAEEHVIDIALPAAAGY